jgi:hypothetical protein
VVYEVNTYPFSDFPLEQNLADQKTTKVHLTPFFSSPLERELAERNPISLHQLVLQGL